MHYLLLAQLRRQGEQSDGQPAGGEYRDPAKVLLAPGNGAAM
jgi:hypothetical protein